MPSLLNIIIGVKKSADAARKGKKSKDLGFLGSKASPEAYKEAQEVLDEETAETGEKK